MSRFRLWFGHQKCANTPTTSPGDHARDGLTKAAMAAPSLEVTAAKETTRKMMMALTERRKSWGTRHNAGWGSLPAAFPS